MSEPRGSRHDIVGTDSPGWWHSDGLVTASHTLLAAIRWWQ